MPLETIGTPALWGGFLVFILAMLVIDLGVFHRRSHEVSAREAGIWTAVWITLALAFTAGIYALFGAERAVEFTTGYLIEKALAIDNIFVFAIIFAYFAIPAAHQHRVLFWGVLGALVMRAGFILVGGALLQAFHWVIYLFGGLLLLTGIKLMIQRDQEQDPGKSFVIRMLRKVLPVTDEQDGKHFILVREGRRYATPSLLALIVIEVSDVVFAVDSVPAIFAVTEDPFIVFTSNVFAILGLRSMYFFLARILQRFHLLKVGLSLVLVFVGAKMLLSGLVKIPIGASLAAIALILGGSIGLSLLRPRREQPATP